MAGSWSRQDFPRLRDNNHAITSDADPTYNCFAWAAGDTENFWDPDPNGYWPPKVPREMTITAYTRAYRTLGYKKCDSPLLEPGVQKVALYA